MEKTKKLDEYVSREQCYYCKGKGVESYSIKEVVCVVCKGEKDIPVFIKIVKSKSY